MNDLLLGLLSALVATNSTVAVSNLIQQKIGVSLPVSELHDPVAEQTLRKLMADDDEAAAEVDQWIRERAQAGQPETDVGKAAFRARILRRLMPVRRRYDEFLEKHPDHVEGRLAYASFLYDIGDEPAAEAQWERVRTTAPDNPAVWNNLANYFGHNGKVKRSFEYYAKAIELEPNEPVYYQNLATTVFLFRKDAREYYNITEPQVFEKAMSLYARALSLDPENFKLAAELAQSYYGMMPLRSAGVAHYDEVMGGLAVKALAAWQVALKLARNEVERQGVHLHLARWQMNVYRYAAARRNLAVVTNDIWAVSKQRLLKNLTRRETRPAPQGVEAAPKP